MTAASCSFLSALAARRVWLLHVPVYRPQLQSYSSVNLDSRVRNRLLYRSFSATACKAQQLLLEPYDMSRNSNTGSAYLQILGLGLDSGDATPSVLLFFDQQRYIFNAGEGFQRYCVQHKVKLSRMPNILVTRASLDAAGGIPGMLLTMADASLSQHIDTGLGAVSTCRTEIYGPKGIRHLETAMSCYMRMKGINFHEIQPAASSQPDTQASSCSSVSPPIVQTEAVSISPVVLQPASCSMDGEGSHASKRQKIDDSSLSVADDESKLPLAACYICRLTPVPGKFLPQKAKELGVTPGPLFGQLKAGNAVMGKDRLIQPEEVLEAAPAAPVVIIADCPTSAHLPALLASPAWTPFTTQPPPASGSSKSDAQERVNCIIHLAPQQVVEMPEYQQWMAGFAKSTKQVVVNCEAVQAAVPLPSSATLQIKLNCINAKVFPLPQTLAAESTTPKPAQEQLPRTGTVSRLEGSNLLKYNLRPASRVDSVETAEQSLSVPAIQGQLKTEMPEVMQATERGQQEAMCPADDVPQVITQAGAEEVEVVFLGTGAAMPSKYRNVTSIYINRFSRGGLLLDCGEGTLGQLTRRFGHAGVRKEVCPDELHLHANVRHQLAAQDQATILLLAARAEWLGPGCSALPVFGPWPLEKILRHTAALQLMPHLFFNQTGLVAHPHQQPSQEMQEAVGRVKAQLGLKTLQSLLVVHCAHAYAAILEGESGWKVVFSGDTRPCDQMVHAAKDATLLIHEATFEDELVKDALAKRHSLTCEAVQIGAKSRAYRTILTHFSQRYPKIPKIEKSFLATTCIAFDLMSVNLKDLPQLPCHVPAVTLLCKDVDEDGDEVPST